MSVQVTEFSLVVNGFGVEKNRRMPAKDAAFDNALGVEETAARVERISVLLNSINVEKNLRKPSKVAAFCGRIVETVNQAAIFAGLYCCNVERESQTLSNGAICGSGGFRGQEAAERVAGISEVLYGFNVEKKLQTFSSGAVFGSGGFRVGEPAARVVRISVLLRGFNVEKNPGMSEKVAVVENSLGNDFYKRSVKKCRYE